MQKRKQINKNNKKHTIEFENNSFLPELYGNHDENLAKFENYYGVAISYRGNILEISGDHESSLMAADKIMELYNELDNGIILGIKDIDVFLKSKKIEKDKFLIKTKNKKIYARSKNQEKFVDAINNNDLVFGVGPAGTGKTYLAVAAAVQSLINNQISRIILSRPAVEAGERLGFLPGDLKEKIDPYLRPLYDALNDLMPKKILESNMDNGVIEIAPLAFMRGRTLENAFIILDEAQNTTNMQMKMFVTRLGRNSKMVILGDITQIDLPAGSSSGLKEILKLVPKDEGIDVVNFQNKDIVRHRLVDKIVKAYSKLEKQK
ncbi:MAG: PhoH family protein [Pseudomonadota bacterium]|jgi:phosphate starvation-inducible PhoH-like protein|nr:PhoH family protein [Pseudomonadota bacterium]|tara:strand:+ start:1150 stop:2109 length:960 start_codon:yes stop_codon:yes gene_type:complete